MIKRRTSSAYIHVTLAGLGCMFASATLAQGYPTKPIQLVVPFSAGGDADMAARNLSAAAQIVLGQPVIVLNKAGANGAIGATFVKDSSADGYTLLVGRIGSQVLLPALQPRTTPYQWKDFTYIGLLELNPVVCVVHPESAYRSLADLANALKAQPGKLNYSHSGPATVQNLAPQLFFASLNMRPDAAINVPYKGGNEVAMAVITKDVDFACNNLSSMTGLLSGGKLRALVTTTPERLSQFPEIPTAREAGFSQLEAVIGWSALVGPPKMNPDAVKKWADALKQVAKNQKWVAGNANFGGIPHVLSPEETEKYVSNSFSTYADLVRKAGLETQ
ncbi:tripartite tricarboxylate transporter substrate binding protein [Diaphorobacter sp. HDW4A]|uniref:Bug family tripartite tricarboxylate transporter substrate binding protein n=1 Tax=Diaphorobacter sp. HDW4A TaxID=2714924 RepID=UPI00140BA450|nr:tripartite tricarboxylate transporter substrate binding protein [Diaphorobacter sp. HDW4A]QIL81177.1 tripartite tricarboxylate transporter substrate binding protein [Diaphorobacter sp. HDW4A]